MIRYSCCPLVVKKLIEREVCRLSKYLDTYKKRKIAIFPAGNYAQQFYHRLKKAGINVDVFVDNNVALLGKAICDQPILFKPWEADPDFKEKYFVLIATKPAWTEEISAQLSEAGVPCLSSDAYEVIQLWEQVKRIASILEDDYSRAAYFGLAWFWLTHDTSLCQSSGNQYFSFAPISITNSEIIADLGAFVGDTLEEFICNGSGNCTVYSFEPDADNYEALELRIKRLKAEWCLDDSRIIPIRAGVGAETGVLHFIKNEHQTSSLLSNTGERKVKIYSLDDYFKDKRPPSLIKADIEGGEQDMLRGTVKIIKSFKPKLAICIYHNPDDFVKIPEMIMNLNHNYNLAVRTHSLNYDQTVLYCW